MIVPPSALPAKRLALLANRLRMNAIQEFIAEIRHVLLSSSRIPGVGAALSENVLGAFSTVLERLDQANASLSSTNSGNSGGDAQGAAAGQQARRLAADASTLCALMPATAAAAAAAGEDSSRGNEDGSSRGNGLILRAGQAVGQAAGAMAAAGLHGQGPEFAALQVCMCMRPSIFESHYSNFII